MKCFNVIFSISNEILYKNCFKTPMSFFVAINYLVNVISKNTKNKPSH